MKWLIITALLLSSNVIMAQTAPPQPIEEQYQISYGWWILGVLLAIGIGIGLYMLIKKDPKRDAVR